MLAFAAVDGHQLTIQLGVRDEQRIQQHDPLARRQREPRQRAFGHGHGRGRRQPRQLVAIAAARVAIAGECADAHEVLDRVRAGGIDAVLLDIQMPELTGIEALQLFPADGPVVIFCTAHTAHAVAAFDVGAIDYLLKPVERERFTAAIERARMLVSSTTAAQRHERLIALLRDEGRGATGVEDRGDPGAEPAAGLPASTGDGAFPRRFLVKGDGQMYFVPVDDIDWIEAYGNYVRLHVGKGVHLIRETLGNIERKLDPNRFARVHRSSIVNLDRVARMDLWGAGDYIVLLKDGTRLKLSRWYRSRIEQQTR